MVGFCIADQCGPFVAFLLAVEAEGVVGGVQACLSVGFLDRFLYQGAVAFRCPPRGTALSMAWRSRVMLVTARRVSSVLGGWIGVWRLLVCVRRKRPSRLSASSPGRLLGGWCIRWEVEGGYQGAVVGGRIMVNCQGQDREGDCAPCEAEVDGGRAGSVTWVVCREGRGVVEVEVVGFQSVGGGLRRL